LAMLLTANSSSFNSLVVAGDLMMTTMTMMAPLAAALLSSLLPLLRAPLFQLQLLSIDLTPSLLVPMVLLASLRLAQDAVADQKGLSYLNPALLTAGVPPNKSPTVSVNTYTVPYPQPYSAPGAPPRTNSLYVWEPAQFSSLKQTAILFYQGAPVDAKAYAPLAWLFATAGYRFVVPQMPIRLALYDSSQMIADSIFPLPAFSNTPNWIISGHSFGGSGVSAYILLHNLFGSVPSAVKGVMYIESGPLPLAFGFGTAANIPLPTLVVYGTVDNAAGTFPYLSNSAQNYFQTVPSQQGLFNLNVTRFAPIAGGNHYQVGSYGYQSPDNIATICDDVQRADILQAFQAWPASN